MTVGPDWLSIDESFKAYESALAALAKELIVNGYHAAAVQLVNSLPEFVDAFGSEIGDRHNVKWS